MHKLSHHLLLVLLLTASSSTQAHAASVDLTWMVDLTASYLETALIALSAGFIGWLTTKLGRWVGFEIERSQADALHGALARGVRQAVSIVRAQTQDHAKIDVESRLIAETAIYLEELMPDALTRFGLDDEALDRMIRAYLGPDVLHWTHNPTNPTSGSQI